MTEVELKRQLKLDDLEVGKVFDESELIIELDGNRMTTIRNEEVFESGRWCDIRVYRYDLIVDRENVLEINNNGYSELCNEDKFYSAYKQALVINGSWGLAVWNSKNIWL